MNYGAGAGGQYGQPPMGMQGPPLGPNGQPMHPQMMQPGMQRMMMHQNAAAGMRGAAGMYGHHPQMSRQQAAMMQQGMGYSQMAAAQQHAYSKFPAQWRANIEKEQNPERRQFLMQQYMREYQSIGRQNMTPMGGSGMMPPNGMPMFPPQAGGPMPPGMTHMQNKAMMHSAQMQQMRLQQQQQAAAAAGGMHGQPGAGGMSHPSAVGPQVSALQNQAMAAGSPSTLGVPGQQLGAHGSPQVAAQPTTPQNPNSVQPASVEMKQPPSVGFPEEAEYKTMVSELRSKYLDQLNRIGDRCNLDNAAVPRGYKVLMEILGAKRTVAVPLLMKASKSVKSLCERSSLSFPIMDEVRKVQEDDEGNAKIITPPKPTAIDPWGGVRHLFIRVPDDVLRVVETPAASPKPGAKRSLPDEDNVIPLKTPKLEEDMGKVKPEPVDEEEEVESPKPVVHRVELECMFGKGKKWQMSEAASQELADIPWRLDPDTVPPSYRSPDVTICFDSKILLVPPLRVMLPADYPSAPPVVLFDRSFPIGMQLSAQLATLFERRLSLVSTRSLTCIYESFKTACEELVRLKKVQNNHHMVPTKHRQKQLVA